MKKITLKKSQIVKNTDKQLLRKGIVAFQIVTFIINFYGKEIETTHDTKIMQDGSQYVIGGCGYIQEGYKVF
jgi:Na+-translocating ferredoxin:NAD+ oxidoreductase RnfC subunit